MFIIIQYAPGISRHPILKKKKYAPWVNHVDDVRAGS